MIDFAAKIGLFNKNGDYLVSSPHLKNEIIMAYYISKKLKTDFNSAIDRVTETLKDEGFGIISTINLQEKLKEKLGVDYRKYTILGACNPGFAYEALQLEDKIGTMLPCNVIVQELDDDEVEVAAINPVDSMQAVNNPQLDEVAGDVKLMLSKAIDRL